MEFGLSWLLNGVQSVCSEENLWPWLCEWNCNGELSVSNIELSTSVFCVVCALPRSKLFFMCDKQYPSIYRISRRKDRLKSPSRLSVVFFSVRFRLEHRWKISTIYVSCHLNNFLTHVKSSYKGCLIVTEFVKHAILSNVISDVFGGLWVLAKNKTKPNLVLHNSD